MFKVGIRAIFQHIKKLGVEGHPQANPMGICSAKGYPHTSNETHRPKEMILTNYGHGYKQFLPAPLYQRKIPANSPH